MQQQQRLQAAVRSLYRILKAIEDRNEEMTPLTMLRHLVAFEDGLHLDPAVIDERTPTARLHGLHPCSSKPEGSLVGDFSLYEHYLETGEPFTSDDVWQVRPDGSIEAVYEQPVVEDKVAADRRARNEGTLMGLRWALSKLDWGSDAFAVVEELLDLADAKMAEGDEELLDLAEAKMKVDIERALGR